MNISPSQYNSYGYSGVYTNIIFEVYTVYLYKIIIYILLKILTMAIEVYTV